MAGLVDSRCYLCDMFGRVEIGGAAGDILCLLNCTDFFPFFILGFFTRKYDLFNRITITNSKWLLAVSVAGYLVLFNTVMPVHALSTFVDRLLIRLLAVVAICLPAVRREDKRSKIETALEAIGRRTLDIYVIHYFFVTNINPAMFGTGVSWAGNTMVLTAVTLMAAVMTACLSACLGNALRKINVVRRFAFGDLGK